MLHSVSLYCTSNEVVERGGWRQEGAINIQGFGEIDKKFQRVIVPEVSTGSGSDRVKPTAIVEVVSCPVATAPGTGAVRASAYPLQFLFEKKQSVAGGNFRELPKDFVAQSFIKRQRLEAGGFQIDQRMTVFDRIVLDRLH